MWCILFYIVYLKFYIPPVIVLALTISNDTYEGRVESAIFLGPTVRYQIRLNEKIVVIADRAAIEGEVFFSTSEIVTVGWEVAHCVVLPA